MALKLYPIANFGTEGINTDGPWSVDPGYLSDGANFRVQNGMLKTNNGIANWAKKAELRNTGEIVEVGELSQGMYLICTTHGLYSFDGITTSLLNEVAVIDPVRWTSCMNGGIPVVNHPEVGAFYWYPVGHGVPLKPLPFNKEKNWDRNLNKFGNIIRSHKNYMFMLDITEVLDGTTQQIPDGYHWSHPSDINSVPPSWDETDRAFLAGIAQIGGNSGRIIDGLSMRDSFVIYSEHAINLLTESNDIFVWNRTPVINTTGPISDACVVEVMGTHFILCPDDMLMFDGNSVQSIAQGKIRNHFKAYINQKTWRTSYAFKNLAAKEIWFCVPGAGSDYPTLAYIYNWVEQAWSFRDLPENLTYAVYGSRNNDGRGGVTTWKLLSEQDPVPTWETYDAPWGTDTYNPFDETVVGIQLDGTVLDLDSPYIGQIPVPKTMIMRENFPMENLATFTTIVAAYPKIEGSGDVLITLGSQDYPNAPIRWKPSVVFKTGKQRRVNIRTTGALHAFKIESIGNNQFTMSGIDFEYAPAGLR